MKVILKNPLKQTTMLPTKSYLQLTPDLRICRILNGMWQVSGGHGRIVPKNALSAMFKYEEKIYEKISHACATSWLSHLLCWRSNMGSSSRT